LAEHAEQKLSKSGVLTRSLKVERMWIYMVVGEEIKARPRGDGGCAGSGTTVVDRCSAASLDSQLSDIAQCYHPP